MTFFSLVLTFVLFCFVFRLYALVKAAALRSVVLRYADDSFSCFFLFLVVVVVVVFKSRSGLYSVLSNIRTGPSDADAFRGHRLTTQKGYTHQKEIKAPRKVNTHAIIGK